MALLSEFAALCQRLARTPGRLDKRRLVADYLRGLPAEDVGTAVAFLTGRPFPVSDPRTLNVRGLPPPGRGATGSPVSLGDVAAAFSAVAEKHRRPEIGRAHV